MKAKKNHNSFDTIQFVLNILIIICIFIDIYYLVDMHRNGNTNDLPLPLKVIFLWTIVFSLIKRFFIKNFAPRDSKYYKVKLWHQVDEVAIELSLKDEEYKELFRKVFSMERNGEIIDYQDICNIARLIKKLQSKK